jgi:dihydroorotate dehydrogenase
MIIDPWTLFGFDPYPLLRPFLFLLDPEVAHVMTIKMLQYGLGPRADEPDDPILHTNVFGLDFPNPVGLAAGLDKQAEVIDQFMRFGFGSIEIGGVTPLPQPGNPKPRMVRVPTAKGLINRFGFNSVGADVFAERLKKWRENPKRTHNPVGVNLGKNANSIDDAADYVTCLAKVGPFADFVTINVSSPNTTGLRDLQERERLSSLLEKVMSARQTYAPRLPVLVKISPDVTLAQQEDIAAVVLESGIQGLIVGNTSLMRPDVIPPHLAKEAGGFSGPAMFEPTTQLLSNMYKLTQGKIPLIGNCAINSGEDAYRKIRAGASLVQIYTVLVYEGPLVVRRIKKELAACLRRDGFASMAAAVGADYKD